MLVVVPRRINNANRHYRVAKKAKWLLKHKEVEAKKNSALADGTAGEAATAPITDQSTEDGGGKRTAGEAATAPIADQSTEDGGGKRKRNCKASGAASSTDGVTRLERSNAADPLPEASGTTEPSTTVTQISDAPLPEQKGTTKPPTTVTQISESEPVLRENVATEDIASSSDCEADDAQSPAEQDGQELTIAASDGLELTALEAADMAALRHTRSAARWSTPESRISGLMHGSMPPGMSDSEDDAFMGELGDIVPHEGETAREVVYEYDDEFLVVRIALS